MAKGPTAEEVERIKTQARAGFVRGIERIGGFGGKSDTLARGQVLRNDPAAYLKTQRDIQATTAADLQGAASRWLSDGVYVLNVTPFPDYTTVASTADRSKMPDVAAPPDAPLPPTEQATLSNGVKVILARRQAIPVVRLSMVLDGGYSADKPDMPGVSSMTMSMLDQGTTSRSATQLADQLALIGANLFAGANLDTLTVGISALTEKIDPALDLYADVVLHPSFPAADLARVK